MTDKWTTNGDLMMRIDEESPQYGVIDISRLFRVLYQQRAVAVLVLLFVIFLGWLYTFLAAPEYEASSTLEVFSRRPRIISAQEAVIGEAVNSGAKAMTDARTTVYHKIKGSDVVNKVIAAVKKRSRASNQALPMTADELRVLIEHKVVVTPVAGSNLIDIKSRADTPEFAAFVANTYAEVIVAHLMQVTKEESMEAVKWLLEQSEAYKQNLVKNEARLLAFRQQRNIDGLKVAKASANQAMISLSEELVNYETRAIVLKEMLARLKGINLSVESAGVIPSSIPRYEYIQAGLQEMQSAQEMRDELLDKFTEEHPDVVAQMRVIESLENKVRLELKRAIATAQEDLWLVNSYISSLSVKKSEEEARSEVLQGKINTYNTEIVPLQRSTTESDTSYQGLLNRIEEARLAADEETSVLKVIQDAEPPRTPVVPNVPLVMALAVVIGGVLSVSAAFAYDSLKDRVMTVKDIEQDLGQNVLGLIPHKDEKVDTAQMATITLQDKFGQFSESFAGVRANLVSQGHKPEEGGWIISVVGTTPEEGKTSVSSNLAITMAKMSRNVLLIDGDFRRPKIPEAFGVPHQDKGLVEVLSDPYSGLVAFSLLPVKTDVDGLSVVLGQPIAGVSPTEVLENGRLSEFLVWARSEFDVIIIDTPPIGLVHDAFTFGRLSDDVVMVARFNKCRKEVLKHCLRSLYKNKCRITGVVINDYSASLVGSSYNYGYGGYGGYQYEEDA